MINQFNIQPFFERDKAPAILYIKIINNALHTVWHISPSRHLISTLHTWEDTVSDMHLIWWIIINILETSSEWREIQHFMTRNSFQYILMVGGFTSATFISTATLKFYIHFAAEIKPASE